jgi:hypothetical protein
MLSNQETEHLARLARTARTADVIDFLRALARTSRVGDMPVAIEVVGNNCEINGADKRGFLGAQLPGILTNNYFTIYDHDWYEAFVHWSARNSSWAEPIRAAASSGADLERAVADIEVAVRATMRS